MCTLGSIVFVLVWKDSIFEWVNNYKLHDKKIGQTKLVKFYSWDDTWNRNMFIYCSKSCLLSRIFSTNIILFILKYLNHPTNMNK